jgi:hypothetical protein
LYIYLVPSSSPVSCEVYGASTGDVGTSFTPPKSVDLPKYILTLFAPLAVYLINAEDIEIFVTDTSLTRGASKVLKLSSGLVPVFPSSSVHFALLKSFVGFFAF